MCLYYADQTEVVENQNCQLVQTSHLSSALIEAFSKEFY